jgi:hypothetical protein
MYASREQHFRSPYGCAERGIDTYAENDMMRKTQQLKAAKFVNKGSGSNHDHLLP